MRRGILSALLIAFLCGPGPAGAEINTCHPGSGDRHTGSTTFWEITRTSEIAAVDTEDGWARFDISAVPDDHIISDIAFHFYVNHAAPDLSWAINPVSLDPLTAPANLLSGDINGEPFGSGYTLRHESGYTPGWKWVTLGGTALIDLGACLVQDWFAIGIRRYDEFIEMDGWAEANTPYLVVQHKPTKTWYVDDDAPADPGPGDPLVSDPDEDGSGVHPFDSIQEALDAAQWGGWNSDTILVADGTYTGEGNRDIDFNGKAVLLRSVNGPEHCIIRCEGSEEEHHRGFIFQSGETFRSEVRGITVTGGYALNGGGIDCEPNAAPTISGMVIQGNVAEGVNGYRTGGGGIRARSAARILGCTISGNTTLEGSGGGGGILCGNGVTVSGCLVAGNTVMREYNFGGGIYVFRDNDGHWNIITGNTIRGNQAEIGGGLNISAECTVAGNIIEENRAVVSGGGINGYYSCLVANNLVRNNHGGWYGGGIFWSNHGAPLFTNNTITGNTAEYSGGGYGQDYDITVVMTDSILWGNSAPTGKELYVGSYDPYATQLTISYSDVEGGQDSAEVHEDSQLTWGPGMIDADPLFTSGPLGTAYLSHLAAGQGQDSPCVNAGSGFAAESCYTDAVDPLTEAEVTLCLDQLTTRSDLVVDEVTVDMGFHYPPESAPPDLDVVLAGPGPAVGNPPLVRGFAVDGGPSWLFEFSAYGVPNYGVNVAAGDLDGDGYDEILTGAGPGAVFGPHVRGFDPGGTPLPGLSFLAYGTSKFGVNVTAGDLDGNGRDEIITGAGPGAVFGPHVRAFTWDGVQVEPLAGVSYFAYGTLKWGVNVTAGDLDGDGIDEIVTGAGPGAVFGPHVRGWKVDGESAAALPGTSFFAYGTNKFGVRVSCGDVDGDGIDEIVTAPGPSSLFGAHVRGFETDGTPLPGLSFLAWPLDSWTFGATVHSGSDLNADGRDEILVGLGPDPEAGTAFKVFGYVGGEVVAWFETEAFEDLGLTHGIGLAAGRFPNPAP